MSLLLGTAASVIATCGLLYAGHKGWHAFHRVVGITPGTPSYTSPSDSLTLPLSQLQLDEKQTSYLPQVLITQLTRIDHKADIYQQWQDELAAHGHLLATTEIQFTVRKLMYERIPMMIAEYHTLAQHQQKLLALNAEDHRAHHALDTSLSLLVALLDKTEQHLDTLLAECRHRHEQEFKVMQRYLDKL